MHNVSLRARHSGRHEFQEAFGGGEIGSNLLHARGGRRLSPGLLSLRASAWVGPEFFTLGR